jgi:MFS superfamily sulfate permease-like transporter
LQDGDDKHWLSNLKHDVLASVVVFLVAFPLCMGIAIASGVPTERAAAVGIITGIIGGFVAGSLAGCPLQVSGPAAGLAVMVAQIIGQHGMRGLAVAIVIGGALQCLAGVLRIGQWFRAVSPAIIQGMLAGIGILILASQFHVMVDDAPPGSGEEFGGLRNLVTIPVAVWKGLTMPEHRPAAIIGVLTIVVIVVWTMSAPKRLRFIPAPLAGVILATAVAAILRMPMAFITVPDNLLSAVSLPSVSDYSFLMNPSILIAGIVIAFVASAESLLTATAVDAMQTRAPRTRYDRELIAQGTGNLLCGIVGALPMTGVIVRSSTNVMAGARTRLSTILHGCWMVLFASLFAFLLRMVPVSSLAAILVYTGWKLANPKAAKQIAKYGKSELAIYAATLIIVVSVDLLTGIVVGLGLAIAKLIYTFSHLSVRVEQDTHKRRAVIHLSGAATFLRLPKLAAALQSIPQ